VLVGEKPTAATVVQLLVVVVVAAEVMVAVGAAHTHFPTFHEIVKFHYRVHKTLPMVSFLMLYFPYQCVLHACPILPLIEELHLVGCGSCKNRRFGRKYRPHHHGGKNRQGKKNVNSFLRLLVTVNVVPSSPILVILMMEAIRSLKLWFLQEPHGITS
jgi:hypothetical protein